MPFAAICRVRYWPLRVRISEAPAAPRISAWDELLKVFNAKLVRLRTKFNEISDAQVLIVKELRRIENDIFQPKWDIPLS